MNSKLTYHTILKGSIVAIAAMLFSACYKPIPKEEPVLSKEKIVAVLKDVHVGEAWLTEMPGKVQKDSLARIFYSQVFRLHDIKPEDFEQTMNAYFSNPVELDSLYEAVIGAIAKEKNEMREAAKEK